MRLLIVTGVALAMALPGWAAPAPRAKIELRSNAPLVVHGAGFGRGERVVVIANVPGTQEIVNLTARRGRFAATFTLSVKRCTALTVRALGSLGSRAILQRDADCGDKKRQKG
jgi:hypothetical protein